MYLSEIHPEIVQAVAGKSDFVGQLGASTWGPCPQPKDVRAAQMDLGGVPRPQTLPKKVPVKIIFDPNDVTPLTDTHMQPLTLPSRTTADDPKQNDFTTISPSLDGHSDPRYQYGVKGQAPDEPRRPDGEGQSAAEEVTEDAMTSNLKRSQSLKDHVRQLNRTDAMVSPSSMMVLRRKQSVDAAILAAKESDAATSVGEKPEPVPPVPEADIETPVPPSKPEASAPQVSSQNQPTMAQAYSTSSAMPGVILSQMTGLQSQPRTILAEKTSVSQQPRVAVVPLHRASQPALAALQTNDLIEQLHHLFPNFVPGGKPLSAGVSSHTGHPLDIGTQLHLAHTPQPGGGASQARLSQVTVPMSVMASMAGHAAGGIQQHLVAQSLATPQLPQAPRVVMSTGVFPGQGQQQASGGGPSPQPTGQQQLAAIASVLQNLQQLGSAVGPVPAAGGQLQRPGSVVNPVDGSSSQLVGGPSSDAQGLAAALCLIQQYGQNPEQLEMLLQQQHQQAPMRQLIQQAASLRGLSSQVPGSGGVQTGAQISGLYGAGAQQPTGQGQPQLKPMPGSQGVQQVQPSSFPLQQQQQPGQGLPGQPSAAMLEGMMLQSGAVQTPLQGARVPLPAPTMQTSQAMQMPLQGPTALQSSQFLAQVQMLQGQLQSQAQLQAGQAQLQSQLQAGQQMPMHAQMLQGLLADAQAGRMPGQVQQPQQGQLQGQAQTWSAPKTTDFTHQGQMSDAGGQNRLVQLPTTVAGQQPQMVHLPAAAAASTQNGEDALILQQLLSQKAAIEKYLSQHYEQTPQLQSEQALASQLPMAEASKSIAAPNLSQAAASQGLWGAAKMPSVEGSLPQRREGQAVIGLLAQQQQQQALQMPVTTGRTLTPMEQTVLQQTTTMRQAAAVGGSQAKDPLGGMQLMGGGMATMQNQPYTAPFLLDQGQAMDDQLLLMYLLQQQQLQQQQDQQSLSYADAAQSHSTFPVALQLQSGVIPAHLLASRITPLASQQFTRQVAPPSQQATMAPSSLAVAQRVAQAPAAGTGESLSQQQQATSHQ